MHLNEGNQESESSTLEPICNCYLCALRYQIKISIDMFVSLLINTLQWYYFFNFPCGHIFVAFDFFSFVFFFIYIWAEWLLLILWKVMWLFLDLSLYFFCWYKVCRCMTLTLDRMEFIYYLELYICIIEICSQNMNVWSSSPKLCHCPRPDSWSNI